MKASINLQTKILLIVISSMTAILLISLYLHGLITKALVEEDHYNAAISKMVALASQITAAGLLDNPVEMQKDLEITKNSYGDFKQIDVYYTDSETAFRSAPRGRFKFDHPRNCRFSCANAQKTRSCRPLSRR